MNDRLEGVIQAMPGAVLERLIFAKAVVEGSIRRGLDLSVLDAGFGERDGHMMSTRPVWP